MHHLLAVCLLAATLAAGSPPWSVAQLSPIRLTKQPGSRKRNPLVASTGFEVLTAPPVQVGLEPAAVRSLGGRALAIRPRRRGKWSPVSVGPYPGSRTTAFRARF